MVKLLAKFQTRLNAAISASATAIVVDSVSSIPAVPFMAVIGAGSNAEEAVLVTAITTATKSLTVTRAQRSTTAVAHGVHQLFHHSEIEWSDIKQEETFAAAGEGLYIQHTFTLATVGALKSIRIEQTYQPVGGGYGSPVPIASKVSLGEGAEFTGGQAGMYAVQAQLNFMDTAIVNQANSIFAGLRGVITNSGTPVFTAFDTIACIYCDNLNSIDMAGIVEGVGLCRGSALASFMNHGGSLDFGILLRGNNKIEHVFSFNVFAGVNPAIGLGAKSGSPAQHIKIDIDGVDHWINAYPS